MEETKVFSPSEISLHTSKKDCWVVIHGKVYDVTNFLEEHPGGEEALLEAATKDDATEDFEDAGHSSTAIAMMTGYLIGSLAGADSSSGAGSSKSVKEKQERFIAKASEEKQQSSSSSFMNLIPLLIIVVAFAAWYYLNKVKI